jgi:Phytochelatin synthase
MKRRLILGVALLFSAGVAAFVLRPTRQPPPGFHSIREDAAFQSPELLKRAWALPVATMFTPLASQTNPSACGPTSVANVSHSWGAARVSDDVAAHGSGCVGGVCFGGLTLDQLADAARATDASWKIEVLHPATVQALRDELAQSNDPGRRYVINFDRFPLFGMGGGHHSPIGGVLDPEGLIFVLDVNEKFGPWLVTPERLFEAMDTVDSSSGQKRGLLRFTR